MTVTFLDGMFYLYPCFGAFSSKKYDICHKKQAKIRFRAV
jgi:hypothetical protein